MLPRSHRLTRTAAFAATIRRGSRAGSRTLVLHLAPLQDTKDQLSQIGLVVGKSVGKAVTRNQVKRRLRHIARDRLESIPGGSALVIRALPPAGEASSADLAADFDRALDRVRRNGRR